MKIKILDSNEIITTKDFPVYNQHILKIYFKICKDKAENILPPTPVIPLSVGLPLLESKDKKSKEYNKRLKDWLRKNKKVKYLMCDGSHKTTALTLTHNKINSAILKTDKNMEEFNSLVEMGEAFSMHTEKTIKKELRGKAEHLKDAKFFETVEDKTKRMVDNDVIPKFMIDYYMKK